MNRREALKNVAFVMGGSIVGAQAFLSACSSTSQAVNDLFFESDVELLDEIAEAIIPATDTPGAKAAKTGSFMAIMVLDCYDELHQNAFKEGLHQLNETFKETYKTDFLKGKQEDRHNFLTKLDAEQVQFNQSKKNEEPPHYFRMMKELTLLGYFTSEIGSTQALRYIEVPGKYEGCIPYQKGDKAWAL